MTVLHEVPDDQPEDTEDKEKGSLEIMKSELSK